MAAGPLLVCAAGCVLMDENAESWSFLNPFRLEAGCTGDVQLEAEAQIQRSEVEGLRRLFPALPGVSSSGLRSALKDVGYRPPAAFQTPPKCPKGPGSISG